ncbi:MAG: DUF2786 domain-containing protein, partial [Spiribacter salinus]
MSNTMAQKIAKLMRKADSTTHPEEAEAFMSKAQELMIQHGLNLLDLGKLHEDPVDVQREAATSSSSYGWSCKVAGALAALYGCELVYHKHGNNFIYDIVGRESARVTFVMMLPFVLKQIKALARKGYKEGHYNSAMTAATRVGNATA